MMQNLLCLSLGSGYIALGEGHTHRTSERLHGQDALRQLAPQAERLLVRVCRIL
jgi:hypothetical protein